MNDVNVADGDSDGPTRFVIPRMVFETRAASMRPFWEAFTTNVASQFREQLAAATRSISGLEGPWAKSLPPNWRDTKSASTVLKIVELMTSTQWCLVWCPRCEVLDLMLAAPGENERTRVLLENRGLVLQDVRESLDQVGHNSLREYRDVAFKAIRAFEGGHPEAAQALATCCLSSVIGSVYKLKFSQAATELRNDPRLATLSEFRASCIDILAFGALQRYYPDQGDPVPGTFSRHASAHSVSAVQFTEVNSLASLLLLNAFLRETQLRAIEDEEDVA